MGVQRELVAADDGPGRDSALQNMVGSMPVQDDAEKKPRRQRRATRALAQTSPGAAEFYSVNASDYATGKGNF